MKLNTRVRKLIESSKAAGISFTEEEIRELNDKYDFEDVKTEERIARDTASREAEAVIALIDHPEWFSYRICKWRGCNGPFAYCFAKVSYCSDRCRRLSLEERGITWDPIKKPEDRWRWVKNDPIPLVVPPEALKLFQVVLPEPVQTQEESQQSLEPESQPETPSSELSLLSLLD